MACEKEEYKMHICALKQRGYEEQHPEKFQEIALLVNHERRSAVITDMDTDILLTISRYVRTRDPCPEDGARMKKIDGTNSGDSVLAWLRCCSLDCIGPRLQGKRYS